MKKETGEGWQGTPACEVHGITMCEKFEEREIGDITALAPTGEYYCYQCVVNENEMVLDDDLECTCYEYHGWHERLCPMYSSERDVPK